MKTPEYLTFLESLLKSHANPDAAIKMSRYMKNHFEFFGISSPVRKDILRNHIKDQAYIPQEKLDEIVKWCWQADEREYSKTNPEFVISFVQENPLSGLSEREALKWMKGKGII